MERDLADFAVQKLVDREDPVLRDREIPAEICSDSAERATLGMKVAMVDVVLRCETRARDSRCHLRSRFAEESW